MSDKHDEPVPYNVFREWEKQARAEADAMLARFEKRVATGQRLDNA